jgi:hypothetical protein
MQGNTTGLNNTARGSQALTANSYGQENTAMGLHALFANTSGDRNTAVGRSALDGNTTGSNNTALGFLADLAGAALTNATVGANATVDASIKIPSVMLMLRS